jgi:alkaline phosphatase D
MIPLSRRTFLKTGLATGASLALPAFGQAPAAVTSEASRPKTPSGLQIGDVFADRALIWSRSDRPARMWVEHSLSSDFRQSVRLRGPLALETSDYSARVDLAGPPPTARCSCACCSRPRRRPGAVRAARRALPHRAGEAARYQLRLVGRHRRTGIRHQPRLGRHEDLRGDAQAQPDFFIHSGDNIYADGPIAAELKLDDGSVWKNLVTEETSKVAESLREFRGRYAYNLMDENVRRFSAEVPQIWQWDDHEVINNWSDSKDISTDARYTEKSVPLLVARATRAFLEYAPMRYHGLEESERVYRKIPYGPLLDVFVIDMRSYRGANGPNRQEKPGPDAAFLGEAQLAWLKQSLKQSKALWKVVAADMPLSLQVLDGKDAQGRTLFRGGRQRRRAAPGPRARVRGPLRTAEARQGEKRRRLTADVRTAAHYYGASEGAVQRLRSVGSCVRPAEASGRRAFFALSTHK